MAGKKHREKGVEWRRLAFLPFHEVSDSGDIRRCVDGATRKAGSRPVGQASNGYRRVKLMTPTGKRTFWVHRLVCEAWHGAAPSPQHIVAHYDGNPLNNHYSNLRWATCKENLADRRRHGTDPVGSRNPRARLTEADVLRIRRSFGGTWREITELAKQYQMSETGMASVCRGENWKHVRP